MAEFARAYQEEFNRLTKERSQERTKAMRELSKVTGQIDRIVDAIAEGMFHASMKAKLDGLEARKTELQAVIASEAESPPVLLHPGLADRYQKEVARLTETLNAPETKAEATAIIRSLLTEIRMVPEDGALAIELVGELAGILALGAEQEKTPRAAAMGRSTLLVAGAGFEPATFRL